MFGFGKSAAVKRLVHDALHEGLGPLDVRRVRCARPPAWRAIVAPAVIRATRHPRREGIVRRWLRIWVIAVIAVNTVAIALGTTRSTESRVVSVVVLVALIAELVARAKQSQAISGRRRPG